ncbi:MAG: hypothetical protein GY947_16765 [Rhodobacteraceae bacterium]|nr:hypothetical protein [Paracoccaceae bacterium]
MLPPVPKGSAMHPIYALWSHPRSMSTAVERIMRERGDLDCAHEPFMYDYYVHRRITEMPHFDVQPDHPTSYADIRDMLLERAERGPVFIKDMSYYVLPHILEDTEFNARLVNAFLIRDPLAAILSYYKLDPNMSLEEIGLEAQWHHFKALQNATGDTPAVIDADAVRANTKGIIAALWEKLGLPHISAAFNWSDKTPKDWQQVEGWHGTASASKSIRPASAEETATKQGKFAALVNTAPHLQHYLDHHCVFYERLKVFALTSASP